MCDGHRGDGEAMAYNLYDHNGTNTFSLTCTCIDLGDGNEEKMDFAKFYQCFIAKRDIAEKNLNMIVH